MHLNLNKIIYINNNYTLTDSITSKWIGLGIVIGSAILSNLGVNVQKLSHINEQKRPVFVQRTYYTRPLWIIGMILVVLGSMGDFEALGFAPQALVASVGGGCTVLANLFFAHLWLGQILSKTDLIGTGLIIFGVVLSTIINEPDDELSLKKLENQFVQKGFIIYLFIMIISLSAIFMEIKKIHLIKDKYNTNNIIQEEINDSNTIILAKLPYLYATASGIFGSFSVLLAKCASMLLILTFEGNNQFKYVTTYVFLGGMITTLILQTDYLNRAIMSGDTLSVFPVFQCFWIGCSVVGGVVFYQKFLKFTFIEWICLPLAIVLIMAGIYMLSKHEEVTTPDIVENGNYTENTKNNRKTMTGLGQLNNKNYGPVAPFSPSPLSAVHASFSLSSSSYGSIDSIHSKHSINNKNKNKNEIFIINKSKSLISNTTTKVSNVFGHSTGFNI